MRRNTCCFTGHRVISRGDTEYLTYALRSEIQRLYERGVTEFCAGGAKGFDMLAAEVVLELRETLPIHLHLILPCRDQCRGWPMDLRLRYDAILQTADSIQYICDTYEKGCMHKRNDALVNVSAFCICYLQRPQGGTAYTVKKARQDGLEIIHLMTTDAVGQESFEC